MTDFPMTEDIVLLNAGDTQRKGMYVEFGLFPTPDGIDPNGRNPFMDMKGGREHGQRFRVTFHLLGENEECDEPATGEKPHPPEISLNDAIDAILDAALPADEQTPEPAQTPKEPERLKGGARAKRAGILCGDPAFLKWLMPNLSLRPDASLLAAKTIRGKCGVQSRAELDDPHPRFDYARMTWDRIEADYRASQQGQSTEALETMREAGRQ